MKKITKIGVLGGLLLVAMALVSCHKDKETIISPIVGHWGCKQYVSCRTDEAGREQWDTLQYEVGPGKGYEVYFYSNGSGRLLLNDSPALIKKFNCDYEYDTVNQVLTIYNTSWIITLFSNATSADMDIELLTADSIVSSWTNYFSEAKPFFERFYMERID